MEIVRFNKICHWNSKYAEGSQTYVSAYAHQHQIYVET